MKCLILAAGYATRLYPLTENFPKPLLEVQGRSILDWLIDDMDTTGHIGEYIVVSNHKFAAHFQKWAEASPHCITVLDDGTSTNETRLGAVKDIQFCIDSLHINDDLLVIAGDNLLDFSLTSFIDYAREKRSVCVMRYYEPSEKRLLKSGVLTIDEDDRVLGMTEKSDHPATHWCCPPFYYYTKEAVAMVAQGIKEGCGVDAPGSFIAWICYRLPVYAMQMPGQRYDIGTLETYEEICKTYKGVTQGSN